MSLTEIVRDNFKTIVVIVGGYIGLAEFGYVSYPDVSLPTGWGLLVTAGIVVALGGWIVAGKIDDLLPDPTGTFLVAQKASDAQGGAVWELSDDAWESLTVVEGSLFPWTKSTEDVYECRYYNEETHTAVCNWKGTKTASELSSPIDPSEVMRQIASLRDQHEKQARYGEALRSAFPALLRQLDKWRAKDLNDSLEGHISPNFGERSIDDMISEQLPDEVLPDYMTVDDEDEARENEDVGGAIELLDAGDALDPLESPQGASDVMLNDGGSDGAE